MVINMTAQACMYFGTSINPHEQKKRAASFLLEGRQQIFDGTLINEASGVVMRPNDPELKTTIVHPREATPAKGDIPAIMSTRPPTVIFVVKWMKILHALLNVYAAAPDLKTNIKVQE
mmetsp:Transcript_23897/g.45413  ORF Transcript_23897/g.45413 Transcript_23897/m.45413 type:complete len:118 (+) Transcript_23897:121-474(+)